MKTLVDLRLRDEATRFALRFGCDDCVHFDRDRERCTHGYPAEPRRDALATSIEVELCKEFELG
jgi:hypothetical protein